MRRSTVIVLLAALAVSIAALSVMAKRSAKYIGSARCVKCHTSSHKQLVEAYLKTAHPSAMTDVSKKPDAVVAVFDAASPVKSADISYVLGLGRSYQNYLDKDLKLLPGRWLVKEQKWVQIEAADGAAQCVGCHTTNFDPESKQWTELGVGCESCHGAGGAHADSMEAKDIVNPKKLDGKKRNMVCGQCHSQGTDPSGKYAFSTTFVPGMILDDHFKLKTPEPGAVNSQYNEFKGSKHGGIGMACTTCHDAHGDKMKASPQLRKPVNDLCLGCHESDVKSMKAHAPDSKPDDTCATCHMPLGSHKFEKPGK